jgi:hypothetical protein
MSAQPRPIPQVGVVAFRSLQKPATRPVDGACVACQPSTSPASERKRAWPRSVRVSELERHRRWSWLLGPRVASARISVLLVLPLRIELRTSPLPRECSTTELRQRRRPTREPRSNAAAKAAILATRPQSAQARVLAARAGAVLGLPFLASPVVISRHERKRQIGPESAPAAAAFVGVAGKPQAPQSPSQGARGRGKRFPGLRAGSNPRFRRNWR